MLIFALREGEGGGVGRARRRGKGGEGGIGGAEKGGEGGVGSVGKGGEGGIDGAGKGKRGTAALPCMAALLCMAASAPSRGGIRARRMLCRIGMERGKMSATLAFCGRVWYN